MALITLPDSNFDDGVLPINPICKCGGSSKGLTIDEVKEIIAQTVKESDDKLMVNGVEAGTDNYVRSGELEDSGNLKLNLGEDKETNIDLSELQTKPIAADDIKNLINDKKSN